MAAAHGLSCGEDWAIAKMPTVIIPYRAILLAEPLALLSQIKLRHLYIAYKAEVLALYNCVQSKHANWLPFWEGYRGVLWEIIDRMDEVGACQSEPKIYLD